MRVGIALVLFVLLMVSGCSDSYSPTVKTYYELQETLGGTVEDPTFTPLAASVGPDEILYFFDYYRRGISRYTLDGTYIDSWRDELPVFLHTFGLDSEGRVYLLTRSDVRVFSPEGEKLLTWELSDDWTAGDLAIGAGDQVYLLEPGENRINKFSASGDYLESFSFGRELGTPTGMGVSSSGNPLIFFTAGIIEYAPDGEPVVQFDVNAPLDAVASPNGDLFITHEKSRISRYSSGGVLIDSWGDDSEGDPYVSHGTAIAMDASGVVHIADGTTGRISKFSQAGEFLGDWSGQPPSNGKFRRIQAHYLDKQGFVHALDMALSRVLKFSPTGEFLGEWGERGIRKGQWQVGLDLVVDGDGNVFVLEARRVQKFSPSGSFLLSWKTGGFSRRLELDGDGNIYVTEYMKVQKYDPDGTLLDEWEGLVRPHGVVMDSGGLFHVVDSVDNDVVVFTADGEEIRRWDFGGEPGDLADPDITLDKDGRVFISDSTSRLIRVYDAAGNHLTTLMGPVEDRWRPRSIEIDASDDLWVSDSRYNRILVFSRIPGSEFD